VTVLADETPGSLGGRLFMQDGALIDAGTGQIRLFADG
jgi:hypothetical protein